MSNPISYFHKQFDPVPIDADTLRKTHRELCEWIKRAVDLIDAREPQGTPLNSPRDNIYSGDLGIAFMYLRLQQQATCLAKDPREEAELRENFTAAALKNIHADSNLHPAFNETMLSPIGSPKTAGTFLNLLMDWAEDLPCHKRGMDAFRAAVRQAGAVEVAPGQDDVMFGRSGLLWAIQYLRGCTEPFITDDSESPLLNRIFALSRVVVRVIVETGRQTSLDYALQRSVSEETPRLPLMWQQSGRYNLGALHGICGILTTLLCCPRDEIEDHALFIGDTITGLCALCCKLRGNFPSSLPICRTEPFLVQVCQGVSGLLVLLAKARSLPWLTRICWRPVWDEAIYLGSKKIRAQGLLRKGAGICHGVAGNIWTLLMLHDSFEKGQWFMQDTWECYVLRTGTTQAMPDVARDGTKFLSLALGMLQYSAMAPPFAEQPFEGDKSFRMPDHPYSLFEGLSGTVCLWSDLAAVVRTKLSAIETRTRTRTRTRTEGMTDDEMHQDSVVFQVLGFPGLTVPVQRDDDDEHS